MMCVVPKETAFQEFERLIQEALLPIAVRRLEEIIQEQSLTEEDLFGIENEEEF